MWKQRQYQKTGGRSNVGREFIALSMVGWLAEEAEEEVGVEAGEEEPAAAWEMPTKRWKNVALVKKLRESETDILCVWCL